MAPCSKLRRNCMVWGKVSATTVAPRSDAAEPAASWLHAPSGFMAETPSTFQLTGRSARSDIDGEEVHLLVREAVEATGNDELDRRAVVVAYGRGEALHLGPPRGTGGDGAPVAVVVRVDLRGREPERSVGQGGVQRRLHGVEVGRRGLAADGALAHHQPAQGRVPDQEAGVDRDPPVEPVQPVSEGGPVPGQPGSQRGERHPFDPGHHPGDVVDPVGDERSQREPAVATEDGGHPVERATGWHRGPRRAGRRSGCGGRRSPVRPACPGRRGPPPRRPATRRRGRWRRLAHPRMATSARTGSAPVPSTTVPPRMTTLTTTTARDRPAHLDAPAGECLHALGPELEAEAGLLPASHGRVHVDGRDPVGVDEDSAGARRETTSSASASSLLHTDAQSPYSVSFAAATASSRSS